MATWSDYLELCQTIKEATGSDCFAQNKANNYARSFEMMLWQQGLGYYNEQGEITVDSPQNVATLEMLGQFWDAGLLSDQLEWTDGWYAELASEDSPVATLVIAGWMGTFSERLDSARHGRLVGRGFNARDGRRPGARRERRRLELRYF